MNFSCRTVLLRFLTVLPLYLAVLSVCHHQQGAAMSLPPSERVKRQVESGGQMDSGGDEEAAVERLAELRAGIMVLDQETSTWPPPTSMRSVQEFYAFERAVQSVCTLLEFASTLQQSPTANSTSEGRVDLEHLQNILTAIKMNSCTWLTQVYSELEGDGSDCSHSLEKMEVLCAKKRLQSLAMQVTQDLKSFRRISIPINPTKWRETYLQNPNQ